MDFVTQAMGDDFDGQAQITDGSGTKAKAMNVLNGLTQVKRDFAGKVQMQEDSDRQEQVTKDSARQAEYPEDTVGQTVSSADRSSFSGVGEPFPFWRHIPPPTMCFPQRLVPYGYYGCLSSPTRPPPPSPLHGVFPTLWNGTHHGYWPVHTSQVVVGVPPPPPPVVDPPRVVDSSPKPSVSSCTIESHDAAPMDISPSASPLTDSTIAPAERESVTSTETATSTTGETAEVGSTHSVKTVCLDNGMQMPRALKPVKYLHAGDPRTAVSSVLSLLKRCRSCAKKMARAKRKGVAYSEEECPCTQRIIAPRRDKFEENASATKTKTSLEELVLQSTSLMSTVLRQPHEVSYADEPMGSSEPREPSLASTKLTSADDCASISAANLTKESLGTFNAEKKFGSGESETYSIPVIEGRRPTQDSWHRQRRESRYSNIVIDSGPNSGEAFPNYSQNDTPVEYLVNRFIEEIRAASEQKLCAGDSRPKVKISGKYVAGSTVEDCYITEIEIAMDPFFGACVERSEGPLVLQSELEKEDEGWLWTFE
ncbi:hypothetical protein HPB51_021818 [Rhipicephalus microplus]|uniref:Uncharacterized protein n=1 Tax=Rhipicephalus microplus TaxID=6941 RepID=A0A9J6DJ31_RHIMP|nr:hypothetical protein HPB51_021818 [Rhipicephalus microplus]